MKVQELISKYSISLYGEDKIRIGESYLLKKDGEKVVEEIKERKAEIMAFLKNEEEEKNAHMKSVRPKSNPLRDWKKSRMPLKSSIFGERISIRQWKAKVAASECAPNPKTI